MAPIMVFIGGDLDERDRAVRSALASRGAVVLDLPAAWHWPFLQQVTPQDLPPGRVSLRVRNLHTAFPAGQTPGTRLVLTQATYQMQRWLDWLGNHPGVALFADADRDALGRVAPEAFTGRGPWRSIELVDVARPTAAADSAPLPAGDAACELARAFHTGGPESRVAASARAADMDPGNPAVLLALASACLELQRLDDAQRAVAQARSLAPDWEAIHFEQGKLYLRTDDTERAAAAFSEAGRLMPSFSAAFSNLGAALGEMDRPNEAMAALHQALEHDPRGYPILNNLGVVSRDLGLLADAEAAFRQVTEYAPAFVFGYYNLGHTLFLQGRFADARAAYEAGRTRDPQKNPRQGARLGIIRAATGDFAGARQELEDSLSRTPVEARADVVEEVENALVALSTLPAANSEEMTRLIDAIRRYST
jgi:tetratricopeptide (TPR) repeat protein